MRRTSPGPHSAKTASTEIAPLSRRIAPTYRRLRRVLNVATGSVSARAFTLTGVQRVGPVAPAPTIVLDGCTFQEPHGGVSRFWRSVMAEWSGSGFSNYVVVVDRAGASPRYPGFSYLTSPRLRAHDVSADREMLQAVCDRHGADLFISTLYSRPIETKSLLVIHDLTPEVLAWDLTAPVWRDKRAAIARAAAFVCVSENTAADLSRIYPVTANRPTVVALPGVEPAFRPADPEDVERLRRRLDLPSNYYLFIGHRDIHKNAELVFAALPNLRDQPDIGLLLVGGAATLEPRFAELAGSVPVRIERLSDEDLRAAYSGAAAVLYPSRYEGFGLVVLEAMACGCPVITCPTSALPEAAGEAALYVPEDNAVLMAEAMRTVLAPDARDRLVAAGFAHSASFRWERTARTISDAIVAAIRAPGLMEDHES